MHRISIEPHRPLREVDATMPEAFERIIGRALAKKPQDRYTRASEMADELRKAAREATGVGQAYEKTLKVDTAFDKTVKVDAHQKTVKVDTLQSQLLDDLDTFVNRRAAPRKRSAQTDLQRARGAAQAGGGKGKAEDPAAGDPRRTSAQQGSRAPPTTIWPDRR